MARKYGLNGSRGNMIIKEFLVESGVDISRFKNSYIKENKVRRASLKMPGIL